MARKPALAVCLVVACGSGRSSRDPATVESNDAPGNANPANDDPANTDESAVGEGVEREMDTAVPGEYGSRPHTLTEHTDIACSSCDFVLNPSIGGQWQVDVAFDQPDGLLCLEGGEYSRVSIANISGEPGRPVKIRNCDGQVVVDTDANGGFLLDKARYVDVSGVGSTEHLYGFDVSTTVGEGVKIRTLSTDIELSYIRVRRAETTGIKLKPEYAGDSIDELRGKAVMKNVHVHHTLIDFADIMEGHYIGNTGCNGAWADEEYLGTDAWLENIHFHDNIIKDAGADGIQFACTRGTTRVHHNTIERAGYRTFHDRTDQDWGIQLGPDLESAIVHSNELRNTENEGFHVNPKGPGHHLEIYNNMVVNSRSAAYINASVAAAKGSFTLRNNYFQDMRAPNGEAFRINGANRGSDRGQVYENAFLGSDPQLIVDVDRSDEPWALRDYTQYAVRDNEF